MSTINRKPHIGRRISFLRELKGWKQGVLSNELGVSQQTVSNIENSETIEESLLKKIADILGVTAEGILNFNEDAVFNSIGNIVSNNNISLFNFYPTFNPIDKLVATFEENKNLYERLLISEQEKVKLLSSIGSTSGYKPTLPY